MTRARKQALRVDIRAARRTISASELAASSARIVEAIDAWGPWRGAGTEALLVTFAALPGEPDLVALSVAARARGRAVAYPRVTESGLVFRRVDDESELVPGTYGVREPAAGGDELASWPGLAMVVVPGLAFDRMGARLGYGGGYYDRVLASFERAAGPRLVIAAALERFVDGWELPMDEHDRRVPWIATELGVRATAAVPSAP
jgi:5-formyltetrahydrofolate cyclo-ligase